MTERALPGMDGAPACPFVAFGDDREARSTSPDHRHRCFAESPPAPRAIAHQQAYCLSSAFPVCPTFQDWARREAARARAAGGGAADERVPGGAPATAPAAGDDDPRRRDDDEMAAGAVVAAAAAPGGDAADDRDDVDGSDPDSARGPAMPGRELDAVRRNPPRDWAAPPPWLASSEGSVRGDDEA